MNVREAGERTGATKVLVVDDERPTRLLMEKELPRAGYAVTSAASGEEALEQIRSADFEVILLDLKMPDMDGIDVLNKINTTWPDIKVVMITGYSTVETAVQALRLGAYNFIEKPFTPDTLLGAVKEVFEKSGQGSETADPDNQ